MPRPTGFTVSRTSNSTGSIQLDSLISGYQWQSTQPNVPGAVTDLTYSFIKPNSSYFATAYSSTNEYNAVYSLTYGQQIGVADALATWSAVANITFTMTRDNVLGVGDLRFGGFSLMDPKIAAWAYLPDDTPKGGDVWIGPATDNPMPVKGSYDFLTFVHEIGHAIGLKHPFEASPGNGTILAPAMDDVRYTVMSYNDSYSYQPTTPMLLDIMTIQNMYGANTLWQSGNNVYQWASDQSVFETIWDTGGYDVIDASNQLAAVRINLNEGQFSQIGQAFLNLDTLTAFNEGLTIAYGTKIETAIGSAFNDTLIGNDLNNSLDGGAGADTMDGGAGNDTYYVDNINDVVIERGTSLTEIDTVNASVSFTLGANIENLNLLNYDNINGIGNDRNNVITGNAGNNILDGGTGADTLIGGAGNDTYLVDNYGDVIVESSNFLFEIDTVQSSVNWALGANLENLTLIGTGNIAGNGNALNNVLIGNDGNNELNGLGGLDTMIGGKGNDAYVLDQSGELALVQEKANEGVDTLYIGYAATFRTGTIDLSSNTLQNFENVTLNGAGQFTVIGNDQNNTLLGNADANTLQGGAGDDILDGRAGADTLIGGTGNDTYVVDNYGDVITETSTLPGEIDTVRSSVNWVLGANLENLTLTGTGNIAGSGNAQDNVLIGNDGNNELNGMAGLDTMIGGKGNDAYLLDQTAELALVQELANEGTDTLYIMYGSTPQTETVDLSIGNLLNVENVKLLGLGQFTLTGNNLNNTLTGNINANILDGGFGADTLTGGGGADIFKFGAVNEMGIGANRDVITDFSSLQGDKIDLTHFDANLLTAGFNGFTFIDGNDFTAAGQVRFSDHILSGNVSGGPGADFEIQLVGVNSLSANDLVA
ncbi:hypothetical protein DMX02_28575 [Pseudomonas jessenii]|nr:hypothetical protein DMX02_28575 [Pseudomonas jessenii]